MMARVGHTPLTGMRVLDVTTSIAGPYCAQILAALGADVDQGRAAGHGRRRPRLGAAVLERRGDDVPLGQRGQALARRLAPRPARARGAASGSSTVPTSSSRASAPGWPTSSASGPNALRARNPRLVYCSVGAYGHVGPLSREPGYDALMQAAGGLISMTGEPGRPGVRVGSSLIDQGTGTWAALGVLAALLERERTRRGLGGRRLALRDGARLHRLPPRRLPRRRHGPHGQGTRFPMVAPYQVFPTRDGELMIAGGNDRLFAAICGVLGLPALVDDPRFRSNPTASPTATSCARSSRCRSASATRPTGRPGSRRQACRRLRSPTSRTSPRAPQTEALGMLQQVAHPSIPDLRLAALPLSFDGERALHRVRATRRRSAHSGDTARGRLRGRGDRGTRRRRSDPPMSHVSASFSATIRVRLADSPGGVRAPRQRDRRGRRLARRDRPRSRREGHQGARRDR